MGGGSIWRGVTRVVTPAVRVGAATSASTSCSFCKKVGPSANTPRAQTARFHSCACKPGSANHKASTSSVSQQGSALWESDEWEFAEEEERIDHIVFGTLPSRTEIEEASSELQNALRLGLVAPQGSGQADVASRAFSPAMLGSSSSVESVPTGGGDLKQASEPKLTAAQLAMDWVEPPPIRSWQGILPVGRRDNVVEAFRQFQHNTEVQSMVVSLAADPAIWDAVSANEKIQEFKRKLQKEKAIAAADQVDVKDVSRFEEVDSPNILNRWQSFWQKKWSMFVDVLANIIDGLFSVADRKVFAHEDGDLIDRTVKSCTMLALLVLSVVILKRLSVQAA